jgi:hypothetical protein
VSAVYSESLLDVPPMMTAAEIAQTVRDSLSTRLQQQQQQQQANGAGGASAASAAAAAAALVVDEATLTMLATESLAMCRRQVVVEVSDLRQLLVEREELTAGLRQRYAAEAERWEGRLQGMERTQAEARAVSSPRLLTKH